MIDLPQVFLHDADIGTLTMLPSGKTFFSFNEKYLHDPDRQILSQSFFRASGELIPETKASSVKLPAFFSNLLPEGHMRNYLAQLGNVKPTAEFKLIELLGEDLPGAVSVVPMGGTSGLSQEPAKAKQGESKPAYRFSLAGVQLKFSAIAERRGGMTRDMQNITLEHFRKLTQKSQLPQHMVLRVVRETVDATITLWKENRKNFALPADLFACIDKHILGNNLVTQ